MHTNDLHSTFEGIGPDSQLSLAKGHFARLKTLITRVQDIAPSQTLTVDSGDSFAGSLFHLLSASNSYSCADVPPVELKFLSDARFDATILGNHDFDGYDEVILDSLDCASRTTRVPILSNNIVFDPHNPVCNHLTWHFKGEDSVQYTPPRAQQESELTQMTSFVLKMLTDPKTGKQLRVAIIGTFGPDSAELSLPYRHCTRFRGYDDQNYKMLLTEWADSVHETITTVKEKHDAQVVILLAHAGLPEDTLLLKELHKRGDDHLIDLHISSHTHEVYLNFIGKTISHQVNAYGTILGVLQLEYDFDAKQVTLLNGKIPIRDSFYIDSLQKGMLLPTQLPVNADIPMDKKTFDEIERYKRMIDSSFLKNSEFKYATQVGNIPTSFKEGASFQQFVADCVLEEARKELGNDTNPLAVFFLNSEAIRIDQKYFKSLNSSKLPFQFSDVYRALGIGTLTPDISEVKSPGDVIAHYYMTQRELVMLFQANLLANLSNPNYMMAFSSSFQYKTRWWGIPFVNRLYDIKINDVPIEQLGDLIHVAMPNWMTKYFANMAKMTFGILSGHFRDKSGRIIPQPHQLHKHEYDLLARCISRKKL